MKKICTRFFIILILAFLSVNSLGAVMPAKPVDTSTEVYLGGRPLGIEIGADGFAVGQAHQLIATKSRESAR